MWSRNPDAPPRSRWFVFSAGMVGTLCLVGLIVVGVTLTSGRPHATAASAASGAGVSASEGVEAATSVGGCALSAGSQQVPTVAPITSWSLVGTMAAPDSPTTYGPERVRSGWRHCYAHSPVGALYAAANLTAELSAQPQTAVLEHLAAPSAARTLAIKESAGDTRTLSQQASGNFSISGFAFDGYSPAEALISLALTSPGGGLVSLECPMVWRDGDWQLEVPPNATLGSGELPSMNGYVEWSAGL